MMDEWKPISELPTKPGTRIRALVETELIMEENEPALLMGGWRRVSSHGRIVGWQSAAEEATFEELFSHHGSISPEELAATIERQAAEIKRLRESSPPNPTP